MYKGLSGKGRLSTFLLIDITAVIFSFFSAFFLRFDFAIPFEYGDQYFYWLPVFVAVKLISFSLFGLYRGIWRYTSLWDILNIGKSVLSASVVIMLLFGFTIGLDGFPRSIFLLDFIITMAAVCSIRIAVRLYFSHLQLNTILENNADKKKLILIGAGQTGEKIAREIINSNSSPYDIVGFVDDSPTKRGAMLHGYKILGGVADLENIKYFL